MSSISDIELDDARLTSSIYEPISRPKAITGRYFNKLSKRDAKDLSYLERESIETFCNESSVPPEYAKKNGYLRNDNKTSDYLRATIDTMTNILSKHTLPREMILYRGMGNSKKY